MGPILTTAFRALGNFLYPETCAWCFNSLDLWRVPGTIRRLCSPCMQSLATTPEQRCPRCAQAVGPYVANETGCPHCRDQHFAFQSAHCLGTYQGDLQSACLRCKRTGDPYLASALSQLLCERLTNPLKSLSVDVIVPVPHHWLDRVTHRFQMADVIADSLGRFLMLPVDRRILTKRKWTPKQLTLSVSARRQNLKAAFVVDRKVRLNGLRVLLVDDIMTTGTTVHRVAREILSGGAESVHVAVIARGTSTHRASTR